MKKLADQLQKNIEKMCDADRASERDIEATNMRLFAYPHILNETYHLFADYGEL